MAQTCANPTDHNTPRALVAAGALLLDVRTPDEFFEGHLAGAENAPLQELAVHLSRLEADPDVPVVVYCRSGRRSAMAAQYLRGAGFKQVHDIGSMAGYV